MEKSAFRVTDSWFKIPSLAGEACVRKIRVSEGSYTRLAVSIKAPIWRRVVHMVP